MFSAGAPVIDAVVYVSPERIVALHAANKPVPNPIQIRDLIDTGASCTCVDPSVMKDLEIEARGKAAVHTPSTKGKAPHEANQFDVVVVIPVSPGSPPLISGTIPVIEAELEHQGYKALIGRDILSKCLLYFDGKGKFFTLGF